VFKHVGRDNEIVLRIRYHPQVTGVRDISFSENGLEAPFLGGVAPKGLVGEIAVVDLPASIVDRHQPVSAKEWAWPANFQSALAGQEGFDDRIRATFSASNPPESTVWSATEPLKIVRKVIDHDSYPAMPSVAGDERLTLSRENKISDQSKVGKRQDEPAAR